MGCKYSTLCTGTEGMEQHGQVISKDEVAH